MSRYVATLPALLRRIVQVGSAAILAYLATDYIPSLPDDWQALITATLTILFGGVSPLDRYGAFSRDVDSSGQ